MLSLTGVRLWPDGNSFSVVASHLFPEQGRKCPGPGSGEGAGGSRKVRGFWETGKRCVCRDLFWCYDIRSACFGVNLHKSPGQGRKW